MIRTMKDNSNDPTHDAPLILGEHTLTSRLLVGTGKYASFEETSRALEISGTDCVTVAVRRVNLDASKGPSLLEHIDRERYVILPNTAGCFDAESAIRTCVLSRDLLGTKLVKLEVLGDKTTLLPDPVGTLEATEELVDVENIRTRSRIQAEAPSYVRKPHEQEAALRLARL